MRLWIKASWDATFTVEPLDAERVRFIAGPYLADTLRFLETRLDAEQNVYVGWGEFGETRFPRRSIVIHRGDERAVSQRAYGENIVGFKEYGVRRGRTVLRSGLHSAGVAEIVHDALRDVRGWIRRGHAFSDWDVIPIGYSTPTTPAEDADRDIDVSFAGSVEHTGTRRVRDLVANPKLIARRRLAQVLLDMRKIGGCRVEWQQTKKFGDTGAGTVAYANLLRRTKIAMAPRGTSRETFRHFEAAMAGCVVVTEPLPPHWFYADAPFVYVRDWRELPTVVDRLLSNRQRLQTLSAETLAWWNRVCSPPAISDWMSLRINDRVA